MAQTQVCCVMNTAPLVRPQCLGRRIAAIEMHFGGYQVRSSALGCCAHVRKKWNRSTKTGAHAKDLMSFDFHQIQHLPFSGFFCDCFRFLFPGSVSETPVSLFASCFIVSSPWVMMAACMPRFRGCQLRTTHSMHSRWLGCTLRMRFLSSSYASWVRPPLW